MSEAPTAQYELYEAVRSAQSRVSMMEFAVEDAMRSAFDDKLSAETRLAMLAVKVSRFETQVDALMADLTALMGLVRK